MCNKVVDELKNYNYPFIIKSFNFKIIKHLKRIKKEYNCGLLIKKDIYNIFLGKLLVRYCNPDFLAISKKYIDRNGINNTLKEYPILVWTIKNNDEISKYKTITNGYICNNLPFN